MADVDLHGAAAMMRRSYGWLSRHWRTLEHPETGAAFPQPFVGAEKGGRPWWRADAIEAWKAGAAGKAHEGIAQRDQPTPAANDAAPQPRTASAAALLAAAGG